MTCLIPAMSRILPVPFTTPAMASALAATADSIFLCLSASAPLANPGRGASFRALGSCRTEAAATRQRRTSGTQSLYSQQGGVPSLFCNSCEHCGCTAIRPSICAHHNPDDIPTLRSLCSSAHRLVGLPVGLLALHRAIANGLAAGAQLQTAELLAVAASSTLQVIFGIGRSICRRLVRAAIGRL